MASPTSECSHKVELLVPENDVVDPEFTILIPTLDEERTIGKFLGWCDEGIANTDARVEILIVDSSSDATPDIALRAGARVLRAPLRGLGRAYIDAIPYVRGSYAIMGDADCTYDFREIRHFVNALRAGADFVMGSRFRGSIEPGAIPPLHRYFGTPLTTFILNWLFGSRFSDIHCGMRALTLDALKSMELQSQGWEYASEMILKSVHMQLRTEEIPIKFLKAPEGRESHMKRRGWFEPWRAGWVNLKAMLIYGIDFFLMWPGAILFALGLGLSLPFTNGPISLGEVTFSLNWMLLGITMATLGLSMFYSGALVQILFDYSNSVQIQWERRLPYTLTFIVTLLGALVGILAVTPLVFSYISNGLRLPEGIGAKTHWSAFGLWLIMAAFQTFIFQLMVRALGIVLPKKPALRSHPSTGPRWNDGKEPSRSRMPYRRADEALTLRL
jgi:glycosyltransferase involved in cell wall biosynthesis